MTNQGNGSRFFTLHRCRWVTMEEIAPPLHVGGDQVALVTVEIGTIGPSLLGVLAGFIFGFGRVIGLKN